jgi:hypothetical protein
VATPAAAAVHDRRAAARLDTGRGALCEETGEALRGTRPGEVVIAVGAAFGDVLSETINGLQHRDVLAALVEGVRDEGAEPRLVRIRRSSDVAYRQIGRNAAGYALGKPVAPVPNARPPRSYKAVPRSSSIWSTRASGSSGPGRGASPCHCRSSRRAVRDAAA